MSISSTNLASVERRCAPRLEVFCLVELESSTFGRATCIARNISEAGIFLETMEPLPLGTVVTLWFRGPDGRTRLAAEGEVKNHYFLHYNRDGRTCALRGMGVRFTSFSDPVHEKRTLTPGRRKSCCH